MGKLLSDELKDDIRYPLTLIRQDYSQVPVEIHMQLAYNGANKIIGITGTVIDISERIQAEQQALELRVKARTVEVCTLPKDPICNRNAVAVSESGASKIKMPS